MRRVATIVLGVLFLSAGGLIAQGITGFSPAAASRQAALEIRLRAVPDAAMNCRATEF